MWQMMRARQQGVFMVRQSRRGFAFGWAAALWLVAAGLAGSLSSPAAAQQDPVEFMKTVSRELISAARTGSQQAFTDVLNKYGHVPSIGLGALGKYKAQLKADDRGAYYTGLVRFIARYAAAESRRYEVSHAEIMGPAQRTDRGVFVESRVHLKDGSTYDVQWMLIPQGNTYKVRDAQVLTFWMSPFLTDLFEKYIEENGGTVQSLMLALNR